MKKVRITLPVCGHSANASVPLVGESPSAASRGGEVIPQSLNNDQINALLCSLTGTEPPCDFVHDWSAVWDAEEWLLLQSQKRPNDALWHDYRDILQHLDPSMWWRSTPRIRCEAILRALGRWYSPLT